MSGLLQSVLEPDPVGVFVFLPAMVLVGVLLLIGVVIFIERSP